MLPAAWQPDFAQLVDIKGLTVPENYKPGFYKLKNVMITSNGSMLVKATDQTVWENAALELF